MGRSNANDGTIASSDSRVGDRIRGGKQSATKVYGMRNRGGKSIELTAGKVLKRKLRDKGRPFRPLLDDGIEKESLRSTWKHASMCSEQKLGRALTVEDRCSGQARKMLGNDAVVQSPVQDVFLTEYRASLSGEFPENNNVNVEGSTLYSVAFSKPHKIREEFHIKNENSTPAREDRWKGKEARKMLGNDYAVPAPDSEPVVPIRHVFLSDEAYVGGGMMFPPPLLISGNMLSNDGVSSMNKFPAERCNGQVRETLGKDAIASPPAQTVVRVQTEYRTHSSVEFPASGNVVGSTGEGSVLGAAANHHGPKSHTPRAQTAVSKSGAPVEDRYDSFDEGAAAQQPDHESTSFAGHTSGSRASFHAKENIATERKEQVLDAETEAHNHPPSYVSTKGAMSNADLFADVKKAATKGYARKLAKRTLIPGLSLGSEDISLTGYVSFSEEISPVTMKSSATRETSISCAGATARSDPERQPSSHTPRIQTSMLKNGVNSMLQNENDDQVSAPPFQGRALTQEEIPNIRRAGLKLIDRELSRQTPSSAIRRLEFEDVRTGDAARKDLYRSFLHIYGVHDDDLCVSSVNFLSGVGGKSPHTPATLSKSSLDQYPSEQLCNLLKMTKAEYKSNLDRFGYRAITATVLKELIHSAAAKKRKSVTDIHPVLIEELVTTLSQACICGFPSFEVQLSGYNLFSKHPPETRHMSMKPSDMEVDRGVHIDFKSENELSVYSHFYPTPWLGGYVATHIWYDVSVSPDSEQLHYKNFVIRVAFPGVDKVCPERELRSKINEGSLEEGITIFRNHPPRRIPVCGFMLEWDLPDESIPVADMFSVRPAKPMTIRDSVELIRKRLYGAFSSTKSVESSESESEISMERQEESTRKFSVGGFIKSVFMRLCELVKRCIAGITKSIYDLLSTVKRYCSKSKAANTDEKQSCHTERDVVEAAGISIDQEELTDLGAELSTGQRVSAGDDTLEKASAKHKRKNKREARNDSEAYLVEGAAGKIATEEQEEQLHSQVSKKKRSKAPSSTRHPDSYLSDSSIDVGVPSRRSSRRSSTHHAPARTRQ